MNAVCKLGKAQRFMVRHGLNRFRCSELKRWANRRHRQSRHRHERRAMFDAESDFAPPRKLTGFDVIQLTRLW